jgi:hypothetical protein
MQERNIAGSGARGGRGTVARLIPRRVEVVVHVGNHLGSAERCYVEQLLCRFAGIRDARFCECRPHLLVVNYDARQLASITVLDRLREQGLEARLVGAV